MTHSVFVSHSSRDRHFVQHYLLPVLKQNGVSPWHSEEDIQTADEWERKVVKALKDNDWFLVVMSPNSIESDWVRAEVHWAVEERRGRVIPVLLATCNPADLHLRLLNIQYVDFRHDPNTACRELLGRWRVGQQVPASVVRHPQPPGSNGGEGDPGYSDFSHDDERVWLKFRCEEGHATWQQLWEVMAFHEWLHDRRDIEKGMGLWAVCKTHGHGIDGSVEEVRIKDGAS